MKIGLCQMNVCDYKEDNLAKAEEMVTKAAKMGADIICLPEIFNSPYENSNFLVHAEIHGGKTFQLLASLAKNNNVYIVGGSIPEKDGDRIYNTSYVFDREGKLIAKHRKVHLFDIHMPGEIEFMESKTLSAGDKVTIFPTEYGIMGLAICFDIRFSEYMTLIASLGAKVVFIPAAFNMTTGPAHWDLVFQSRAIDNQVFIAGCSPARNTAASYVAYGHSLVVNPWGEIINQLNEEENILIEEIDINSIEKYRQKLPIVKNKRLDLYKTTLLKI